MSDKLELLERLADCVRLAIEDGKIMPKSYVGVAWRDYAERYRWQSVTDEVQAVFSAIGESLTPKVATHRVADLPNADAARLATLTLEYLSGGRLRPTTPPQVVDEMLQLARKITGEPRRAPQIGFDEVNGNRHDPATYQPGLYVGEQDDNGRLRFKKDAP
jgi:hypothetical protein